MDNLKAKWVSILFKLKPAIKNSVDKHKYQKTINSFEEYYSEIDARVNQEKGILAVAARNYRGPGPISRSFPGQNYSLLRKRPGQN